MIKIIIKYLLITCVILSVLHTIICIIDNSQRKESDSPYIQQIDSLNSIIKTNNIMLKRNQEIIDSLYTHKSQINKQYDTIIKNYYNPAIVSDDSISLFIAKELRNW